MFSGPGEPILDILAEEDIVISDRQQMRINAQDSVLARCIDKRIVSSPNEAVVRSIRPDVDLNAGSVTYEQWLTAALVAGTLNVFVNQALANNQVLGIYGYAIDSATPAISEWRFQMGPSGASSLFIANCQHVNSNLITKAYFSKMVGYDPLDQVYIQLMPFLTLAGGQVVIIRGYVAERTGATISGPVI